MSAINSTIEAAANKLPSNFGALRALTTDLSDVVVSRSLGCYCGATSGQIKATRGDEIDYLDPISFCCLACGIETVFFDSSRDGYDGKLNGGASYKQGAVRAPIECSDCRGNSMKLSVRLIYNIDFVEDDMPELLSSAADYFDGCDVNVECTRCAAITHVGSWELA